MALLAEHSWCVKGAYGISVFFFHSHRIEVATSAHLLMPKERH